jgi:hypothetical protein
MQAYKDSGDTASKKGDRIWIAEMYGYSFGAAKSDVWHIWKEDFMLYPSYTPNREHSHHVVLLCVHLDQHVLMIRPALGASTTGLAFHCDCCELPLLRPCW